MIYKQVNILVPAAGLGSRFTAAGYTFPKPLIEVNGKPMLQIVVDNLMERLSIYVEVYFIFLLQKEHIKKYDLTDMIERICPSSKIIEVDGITEGAACTTLLAKGIFDCDDPLIIANSDQYVEWFPKEFKNPFESFDSDGVDAGILTFRAVHPKWSYARLDEEGFVAEVAEKKVISDLATVGIYYWKRGSDYVKYAEQMITKNIRTNNEFYVCPVFNEAIADGKKVRVNNIKRMWGIGTPEDLKTYLEHHK